MISSYEYYFYHALILNTKFTVLIKNSKLKGGTMSSLNMKIFKVLKKSIFLNLLIYKECKQPKSVQIFSTQYGPIPETFYRLLAGEFNGQ